MAPPSPHLLIDGANILHAWPETRHLVRRQRDAARARLVQQLTALHDAAERRVTIVFDGRGPDLVVERPSGEATFSVLTTPAGTTADDVIERLVAQSAQPGSCVVATADRGVRETVEAAGGTVLSPEELAGWLAQAEGQIQRRVAAHRARQP